VNNIEKREAHLSQRGRAMLHVVKSFAVT